METRIKRITSKVFTSIPLRAALSASMIQKCFHIIGRHFKGGTRGSNNGGYKWGSTANFMAKSGNILKGTQLVFKTLNA